MPNYIRLAPISTFILSFVFLCQSAFSQVYVRGYTRSDGTYVAPHYRSNADGNFYNNWSTAGNTNPYTGRVGTKESPPSNYGSDVYVRGYYTSNGTYVAPHYRSAPDGDKSNNWSSVGNVNPYTSTIGTKSYSSSPTSSYSIDNDKIELANKIRGLGYNVDWQKYSYFELSVMPDKIELANEIRALGYNVDWQKYSHSDLSVMPDKIRLANKISGLGYNVDWQKYSYSELSVMPDKIKLANKVRALGYNVDWQKHSYSDLYLMPGRIDCARQLKELGQNIDWQKYSYSELSLLLYKARGFR